MWFPRLFASDSNRQYSVKLSRDIEPSVIMLALLTSPLTCDAAGAYAFIPELSISYWRSAKTHLSQLLLANRCPYHTTTMAAHEVMHPQRFSP